MWLFWPKIYDNLAIALFCRFIVLTAFYKKIPLRLFNPLRLLELGHSSRPCTYSNPCYYSIRESSKGRVALISFLYLAPVLNFPPTSFGQMANLLAMCERTNLFALTNQNLSIPYEVLKLLLFGQNLLVGNSDYFVIYSKFSPILTAN